MTDEQREPKILTKTLTFGLGVPSGWNVRAGELITLTDDQRRAVYNGLRATSRIVAQGINILNAHEYIRRIMHVPESVASQFKPNNTAVRRELRQLGVTEVDDISGSALTQTYALGVKPDFSGEHGRQLLRTGERQLPIHRTDGTHPIMFPSSGTILNETDGFLNLIVPCFSAEWAQRNGLPSGWIALPVRTKKRDRTLNEQLRKAREGEWELKNSRIMRNPRRRGPRWLGQIVVAYIPEPFKGLSTDVVMGIDLGVYLPACVHVRKNGTPQQWAMGIGRGREMLNVRGMIRTEIVRIIRSLRSKDSPLDGEARRAARNQLRVLRKRERRVMKTASQKVAARIADTAKRHGAGVWQMEDLNLINIKEGEPWLTRNWAPGMVIDAVRWQAEQVGAELRFVNPQYTSQRCAKCGHISSENRPKDKAGAAHFKCVQCANDDHADKNAARNLSIEGIAETILEQVNKAPNGAARR